MKEIGFWVVIFLIVVMFYVAQQIFNLVADNAIFFMVLFLFGIVAFFLYRLLKSFTEKQEAAEKEKQRLRTIADAPEPAPKLYTIPQKVSGRQYELLRLTEKYMAYVTAENKCISASARLHWLEEKEHAQVLLGLSEEQRIEHDKIIAARDASEQAEKEKRDACWTGWNLEPNTGFLQESEKYRVFCSIMKDDLPEPTRSFFSKTNVGALYLSNGKYLICTFWYPILFDETANSFSILTYNKISTKRDYRLEQVDGYGYGEDVKERHWYHEKKNGGPDLRYNDNPSWATVYRGIAIITCDGWTRKIEYPNRKEADNTLESIKAFIAVTKTEKYKKYASVLLKTKDIFNFAALANAVKEASAAESNHKDAVVSKQATTHKVEKDKPKAQQRAPSTPIAAPQLEHPLDTPRNLSQPTSTVLPKREIHRKPDVLLNLNINSEPPKSTPPGSTEPYRANNAAGQNIARRKADVPYTSPVLKPDPASPVIRNANQEIPIAPQIVQSIPKINNSIPATDGDVKTVDFNRIEIGEYASPVALTCFETKIMVNTWKDLYVAACQIIYRERTTAFNRMLSEKSDDSVRWIVRPERLSTLKFPQEIGGNYFVETYGHAEIFLKHIKYIMDNCWVSYADVQVEYIEKQSPKSKDKSNPKNTHTPREVSAFASDEKRIAEQKLDSQKAVTERSDIAEKKKIVIEELKEKDALSASVMLDQKPRDSSIQPKASEAKPTAATAIYKASNAAGQIQPIKHFEIPADAKIIKLPTQEITQQKSRNNSGIQIIDFNHIESMAGTKPVALHYFSRDEQVNSWASLYIRLCENVLIDHRHAFETMVNKPFKENGRLWLTDDAQMSLLRIPRLVGNRYYIETNCNATDIVRNCKRILDVCQIDHNKVKIEYRRLDTSAKEAVHLPNMAATTKSAPTKPIISRSHTASVSQQQVPQLILTEEEKRAVIAARQAKAEKVAQERRMQEQQAAQASMAFEGPSALVQSTGNTVITNNLFKLTFEQAVEPDTEEYQLYFVDDMGKAISTKQRIKAEAKGKISTVTFSLQASDGFDSKKEYHLLILDTEGRLKGKIPYQIKISFASDFDF